MPRLKTTKEDNRFKANVMYYITLNGTTKTAVSKAWGITPRATDMRLNNPEKIPIGDVARLARFFGCSFSDLIDGVKFN